MPSTRRFCEENLRVTCVDRGTARLCASDLGAVQITRAKTCRPLHGYACERGVVVQPEYELFVRRVR